MSPQPNVSLLCALSLMTCLLANDATNDAVATNKTIEPIPAFKEGFPVEEFHLNELVEGEIYFIKELSLSSSSNWSKPFRETIIELINSTNHSIIERLGRDVEGSEHMPKDTKIHFLRDSLLEVLRDVKSEDSSLESEDIFEKVKRQGVILKFADSAESYTQTIGERKERMMQFVGQVEFYYQGRTILADIATLNLETRHIFFEGNVKFENQGGYSDATSLLIDIGEARGFATDANGTSGTNHFAGDILKINNTEHFTLLDNTTTVTPREHPEFGFHSTSLESYNEDKLIFNNLLVSVHNQPFFYLPFFFKEPFEMGLQFRFGRTEREGSYVMFKKNLLEVPLFNTLVADVNVYEKLGSYMRVQNANKWDWGNYKLDLSLARYLFNENRSTTELEYTTFTSERLDRDVRMRYKLNYQQTLNMNVREIVFYKNTLRWDIKRSSDPFFTSDLERDLPRSNFTDLFGYFTEDQEEEKERLYTQSARDSQKYSGQYNLSAGGLAFALRGSWNYINKEDFSVEDVNSYDRWTRELRSVRLPDLTLSYRGTIDPSGGGFGDEGSQRYVFADLNYTASLQYVKDEFYRTIEPYEFERENNDYTLSASLSRSLRFQSEEAMPFFDATYTPNLSFDYHRQWGGEELGSSYIDRNRRATYYQVNFSHGPSVNVPSAPVKTRWGQSYGIDAMFPTLNLTLKHNYSKRSSLKEPTKERLDFDFDETTTHNINSSLGLNWPWYGLLLIPNLNGTHSASLGGSYDLLPKKDDDENELPVIFDFDRITSLNGSWRFNGGYKTLWTYNNNISIKLYDTQEKKTLYEPIQYSLGSGFSLTELLDLAEEETNTNRSLRLNYNWVYYFQEESYLRDNMSFSLNGQFHLSETWTLNFSLGSQNKKAYLYFEKKTETIGLEPIHFWEDVFASMGLRGFEAMKEANFKFNSVNVDLLHDLDSWYAKFSYKVVPQTLPSQTGAVRGFFFDQTFSVEINIKSEFSPKRPDPTIFEPWERNLKPDIFENL